MSSISGAAMLMRLQAETLRFKSLLCRGRASVRAHASASVRTASSGLLLTIV